MLRHISNVQMGKGDLGWLKSNFHFSFAQYYNPENIDFGVLRVLNDDDVQANSGFDMHPHKNMEIVTYVVDGELTHSDHLGNESTLTRGNVQYMSAGSGIVHAEHNHSEMTARFLQLWIYPNEYNVTPAYGDANLKMEDRKNKWQLLVANKGTFAPINIYQDVHIYAATLEKGERLTFDVLKKRQAYIVQIEGESSINGLHLKERDALEVIEENLLFESIEPSHFLVIEMAKKEQA